MHTGVTRAVKKHNIMWYLMQLPFSFFVDTHRAKHDKNQQLTAVILFEVGSVIFFLQIGHKFVLTTNSKPCVGFRLSRYLVVVAMGVGKTLHRLPEMQRVF